MASAVNCCLSSSCFTLQSKLKSLSLRNSADSSSYALHQNSSAFKTLSFSNSLSHNFFSKGSLSISTMTQNPIRRTVVCEAAPKKKADSAAKRARQAEKRRIYNKARKSEVRTRMKKAEGALLKLEARGRNG
ncbi:30S ribosomal protein S20 isoform 2 [Theobroma cacao]|uniref:30S ribosomal protein S20 isoform 2 n=1 Tax=Theobroma cacao TaxID=3641 RepID=A0A061FF41_THECC|nr:30S ribosomal protein S20 isoform 2 [Theobroma cacao]